MKIASLLRKYSIEPKRSLGQNFLTNESVARRIAELSELTSRDTVVEIGTGLGILTVELSRVAGRVITYETDRRLMPVHWEILSEQRNVEIIYGDFMKTPLPLDANEAASYVSNIPYHLTSPIIERIAFGEHDFERAVLMVQKEFADRLTAKPSTKSYGSLTVVLSALCEISELLSLSRHSFFPAPGVDSVVTKLTPRDNQIIQKDERDKFRSLVKTSFSERRKTLKNNLKSIMGDVDYLLDRAGIMKSARAEELGVEEFVKLFRVVQEESL